MRCRRIEEHLAAPYGAAAFTASSEAGVASIANLHSLYAAVVKEAGGTDQLLANAGSDDFAPLSEAADEHFDRRFATIVRFAS